MLIYRWGPEDLALGRLSNPAGLISRGISYPSRILQYLTGRPPRFLKPRRSMGIDFPPRDRWLAGWMTLSLQSSTDIKYFGGRKGSRLKSNQIFMPSPTQDLGFSPGVVPGLGLGLIQVDFLKSIITDSIIPFDYSNSWRPQTTTTNNDHKHCQVFNPSHQVLVSNSFFSPI